MPPSTPANTSPNRLQIPFGYTLEPASSLAYQTGSWRVGRPVYVQSRPPCQLECPAGENCRAFLGAVAGGEVSDIYQAWRQIALYNPLPAIVGRVCYHPCQASCLREGQDGAVAIASVERFIGDFALRKQWSFDPVGENQRDEQILVVGSGPLGLSAAYHLRRAGFRVLIREAQRQLGGMMRYGITRARLPEDVLDAELDRLGRFGIEMAAKSTVLRVDQEQRHYDGVVFGGGGGMSLALVRGKVLWNQPAHTERRKQRTVTAALGRGRKVAGAMMEYFGVNPPDPAGQIGEASRFIGAVQMRPEVVGSQDLNLWYYPEVKSGVDKTQVVRDESGHRVIGVNPNLSWRQARKEAGRCFSCGSCLGCDNCYGMCPDNAIFKSGLGSKYEIDLNYCKGCGICAEECPTASIVMIPETW